jgi:serine/threonine-protein kinase
VPGEGGIRFGPYVLQRRIARGGMAEVFLAQQRGLESAGRRVAVKRILPQLASAPDFIQMFLGEARLAAQLSHPNIVHIYDVGKVDADYFIAMEYVDGVHAGQIFRRADADRLSPAMVARIGADAAAALHHAHELRAPGGQRLGLVHRDVSPANLMVSFDGVVKLCDFGIAAAIELGDRQPTSLGLVTGKYAYMSPEQTAGATPDGRSDVYALAIVLWELLAGKVLVPRGDPAWAMRAILSGNLTPIARAAPWTPAPLAEAITWALETRRERRATAAQLAHALEAFIKSSPEIATPMQLGGWLRARFPREPAEPSGAEAMDDAMAASVEAAEPAEPPPLHESRPVAQQRMSPMLGVPAMPPRVPPMSPAVRIAMLALGMCALALLSFAVVFAMRRSRPSSTGHAAALVPRDASADAPPPRGAPLAPDAATDAPAADATPVEAHGGLPAGKLTVHTRQRCEAIVDARRHLPTPIVELELRPGPHKLVLTCGRRSLTRSVTIAPGKTTELSLAPR